MHVELECVGSETKEFFLEKNLWLFSFVFLFFGLFVYDDDALLKVFGNKLMLSRTC